MKIGIITINSENMGNRLQNYAVQEVLTKMGHQVETINNAYCGREVTTFRHMVKICVTGLALPQLFSRRRKGFYNFSKKYIKTTKQLWKPVHAPEGIENEFDYFVCGSDQIWNPYFDFITGNEFLEFAKPEQKVAYAASIGVEEIPQEQKELFRKRLGDYKFISVREKSGAKIIKELLGKEVPVFIDPTLMLSKVEWLKIAERPKEFPDSKYLLTYFLGKKSAETIKFIKLTAKSNNLKVVNLWDVKYKKYFLTNPSEFLYYIANCEMMCTDSFHGTIFSIIMGAPYSVHHRIDNTKNMNSRLDTLLGTLKLKTQYSINESNNEILLKHDYDKAAEIIQMEKKKVNEYLNNVFGRA